VKRSDGRNTVWLDGQPVTGADAQRLADPSKLRDPRARQPRHRDQALALIAPSTLSISEPAACPLPDI
jgi:hypothetical protein